MAWALALGGVAFFAARWLCRWLEAAWDQIVAWRVGRHPERFAWIWCEPFDHDEAGYYMPQTRFDVLAARWTHQEVWEGWRNWLGDWWDSRLQARP